MEVWRLAAASLGSASAALAEGSGSARAPPAPECTAGTARTVETLLAVLSTVFQTGNKIRAF